MSPSDVMGWMWALSGRLLRERVEKLERGQSGTESEQLSLRRVAAEKLHEGTPLTRVEVAAYLSVSPKTIQRLDATGELPRCKGLGAAVRYAASDVLRLASAGRKER